MKTEYIKIISKTDIGGMIPDKSYYVTTDEAKILIASKRAIYFDSKMNKIEAENETEPIIATVEELQIEKTIEEESIIDIENTEETPTKRTYNKKKKK